jgi:hypothetical protein
MGWITLSIGIEAGVVALATSAMLLYDKGVRSDNCDSNKVCTPTGSAANDRIGALTGWNVGAFALAAAGIVGGVLILNANPPDQPRTTVSVSPAGVFLQRSF